MRLSRALNVIIKIIEGSYDESTDFYVLNIFIVIVSITQA